MFHERAIYAQQLLNAEGTKKPKNEADKSSLSVQGDLLGNLESIVLGSLKTGRRPPCYSPDPRLTYHRERVEVLDRDN